MRRAVLDVGSNSVLTLVAEWKLGAWHTVGETSAVTGLGRGTKESGILTEQAMADTLAAIKTGFDWARENGATEILAGGTMALRIARNTAEFLGRAQAQGTPVRLVSGEEEAELGFLAVADDPTFRGVDRLSIVDPGGHSTELVTAVRNASGEWETVFKKSYSVGALGLAEGPMHEESPGIAARLRTASALDDLIGLDYLPHAAGQTIVLGATGTNLVSIRESMVTWQSERVHGAWLDYEEISRAVAWMCEMTEAQRRAIPGIELGRERTLHIGALILERFLQKLHVLGCTVSVRGWRHALLEREFAPAV